METAKNTNTELRTTVKSELEKYLNIVYKFNVFIGLTSLWQIVMIPLIIIGAVQKNETMFTISIILEIFLSITALFLILLRSPYKQALNIIRNEEIIKRTTELQEIEKMELYNNNQNYKKYINEIKGK